MSSTIIQPDLQLELSGLVIHDNRNMSGNSESQVNGDQNLSSGSNDEEMDNIKQRRFSSICKTFIQDINKYDVVVIDAFLGRDRGLLIHEEVVNLHRAGLFTDGQLVRNDTKNKDIRGDEIFWLTGNETACPNIRKLTNDIDRIVKTTNKLPNNGKLGNYKINRRTKAMVACYPGNGAHYVKHVDNPNNDGRVLTAIYYLNENWDVKEHGGILRIFPTEERPQAADIEPIFDRMLFFWSDRRNPHEVQPSYRTRYAITLWYYDEREREALGNRNFQSNSQSVTKSPI